MSKCSTGGSVITIWTETQKGSVQNHSGWNRTILRVSAAPYQQGMNGARSAAVLRGQHKVCASLNLS